MESLRERVLDNLKERRDRILRGDINSIPSPFSRFSEDFLGIEQGKYYCITASTKGAKTQFASNVFIYTPLLYAYKHPEQCRVKIFYYPLEETPEDITVRFMCFLLNMLSRGTIRISPTDLKSTRNNTPVKEEILNLLNDGEYKNILEFFEQNVIFSSSSNPTGVLNECKRYAEEHGTVYTKKQKVKDEFGKPIEVDAFDHYESKDPNEYRIIFFDHVSLTSTERGMTLKQSVDKLSEYCVILRNRYNFTPVIVQQQAFAGESLDAFKENKVRPTIGNLADSKYVSRDCNVALGLFSPFKHELKEYLRYDITKFRDNIRFLEVLVNRGGSPGGIVALFFDGATCTFKELPLPNDEEELNKWYNYLNKIRQIPKVNNTTNTLFFMFSKNYNKYIGGSKIKKYFCNLLQKIFNPI